jgi:hypothetical protein
MIIAQFLSRDSTPSSLRLATHIRRFLESEGQYYLNAKERYLGGEMAPNSTEFVAWRDRLVQACPNFSRLQGLSRDGVISTSFPFLVKPVCSYCDNSTLGSTGSAIAFSSPNFPWDQMLSNTAGYSESVKTAFEPLSSQVTPSVGQWCVRVNRSPSEETALVWLYDGKEWIMRSHKWGVNSDLDAALLAANDAVVARIVANRPMCAGTVPASVPASVPAASVAVSPNIIGRAATAAPTTPRLFAPSAVASIVTASSCSSSDSQATCPTWAAQGQCTGAAQSWMLQNCARSCYPLCAPAVTPPRTAAPVVIATPSVIPSSATSSCGTDSQVRAHIEFAGDDAHLSIGG